MSGFNILRPTGHSSALMGFSTYPSLQRIVSADPSIDLAMNPVTSPAVADFGNETDHPAGYWRPFAAAFMWAGLTLTSSYFFFGWGFILLLATGFTVLVLVTTQLLRSAKENENSRRIFRQLFPKVVITGVFYQMRGFLFISTPNIVNTVGFFEDAMSSSSVADWSRPPTIASR